MKHKTGMRTTQRLIFILTLSLLLPSSHPVAYMHADMQQVVPWYRHKSDGENTQYQHQISLLSTSPHKQILVTSFIWHSRQPKQKLPVFEPLRFTSSDRMWTLPENHPYPRISGQPVKYIIAQCMHIGQRAGNALHKIDKRSYSFISATVILPQNAHACETISHLFVTQKKQKQQCVF